MKIKLAVIFGGKSVEHEISIITAVQAMMSVDRGKYDIIPVYITKENEMYTGQALKEIENFRDMKSLLSMCRRVTLISENGRINVVRHPQKAFKNNIIDYIDVAFPIVHGTNAEDGTLQGYLQLMNLPYVGCDVLSSAVGMDKYVMKAVLKDKGIPVLPCVCFDIFEHTKSGTQIIEKIEESFPYPVIVKPINLGSSIGIKKAGNRKELADAVDLGFEFAPRILVEPAIKNLREINCSVLGDAEYAEASECEEPLCGEDILSFENKYMSGGKSKTGGSSKGMASLSRKIPADIDKSLREEIRTLAVDTFKSLGCSGVSRIDFMIDADEDKLYVNEINTIPGSLAFYLWEPLGLKYPDLLERLISLALKRKRQMESINFSFKSNVLAGISLGSAKTGKF